MSAFSHCRNLVSFSCGPNVKEISSGMFENCEQLETVQLGSGKIIGGSAFGGCKNLRGIQLPEELEEIRYQAFANCESLMSITIPAGVQRFEHSVFKFCNALQFVFFCGAAPEFEPAAFGWTTTTVYYPANNPTWVEAVFETCEGNITWVGTESTTPPEPVPTEPPTQPTQPTQPTTIPTEPDTQPTDATTSPATKPVVPTTQPAGDGKPAEPKQDTVLWVLIALAAVAVLGGAGYFLFKKFGQK
jgi:hypothetical protein